MFYLPANRTHFGLTNGFVLVIFLIFFGTAGGAEPVGGASYSPSSCHALKRLSISEASNTAFPELYVGYREMEKWDILCVGHTVIIDSALESNGGDVIIYADQVIFKAPIDTRSRRANADVIYKNRWDPQYPQGLEIVRNYNLRSVADQGGNYAKYEFPPGVSQFPLADCETAGHPENSREKLSGESPPIWQAGHFSSGDVHIFANSVTVEKSAILKIYKGDPLFCGINPPEPPPIFPVVDGRYPHFEEAVVVTAGMRGGRGGMGRLFLPLQGNRGFSCVPEASTHIGEVNAPGGNGGDAGSVYLYKIAVPDRPASWDSAFKVLASGGDSGSNRIIRGPSANELSSVQGNICALHDQGTFPEGSRGVSGKIIYQELAPTKALELLANTLAFKDSRDDYVLTELAQRALSDRRIIAISFEEFLEKKFADQLQDEQVGYVDDLWNFLFKDKALISKPYNSLHRFDLSSAPLQKLPSLYNILSEFQNFQPRVDSYNVENFFIRTGGVLKIDPYNRYMAFGGILDRIDSAKRDITDNELKRLLGNAVDQLVQIRGSLLRSEFKQQSIELNSMLQSLVEKTKGNNLFDAAPAIGKIISGAKAIVAGISSENYAQVGNGLKQTYEGYQEFEDVMRSNAGAEEQLRIVRQEISALQIRVQALAMEMAAAQQAASAANQEALSDILDARSNLGWRRISRQKFFTDLVKLSLTSYYLDTSRDEIQLRSNLLAIRSLLKSSPTRLADFNFTMPNSDCTAQTGPRCIEIDANKTGGALRIVEIGAPALQLPLLIVSPDIGRFVIDSFGAFSERSQVAIVPLR